MQTAARPRAIAFWLLAVATLVFAMVVVGGITRLTESGLSMVRWEPVSGVVPPLSDADWQAEFDAYKAYPEYQKINHGMELSAFKAIYAWEYSHRLLGRLIGLVFALPLLWFWVRGAIPSGYTSRLLVLLALGGMQGVIGWWMVASGLIDRPDVSHIRLAVHLFAAFLIFGMLIWTALDLFAHGNGERRSRLTGLAIVALVVLAGQITLGAFVAGLDAGHAFAEWPLMGGHIFPEGVKWLEPMWRNIVDHPVIVQWLHRWWAFVAALVLIWLAARTAREGGARASLSVKLLLVVQIALGVFVLLTGVELWVAAAHQAFAALLLASTVWCAHSLGRPGRRLG